MAGTAVFRRGLSRRFTIEAGGEATPGQMMAGAGGDAQIGNLGEINFSAAVSAGTAKTGGQFQLGAQHIGRIFSAGGSAMIANRNYRDVAAMNGDGIVRRELSGFASLYQRRVGSFGIAYAGLNEDAPTLVLQNGFAAPQHSQVLSANYALQIKRVWLNANGFKNFAATSGSSGFQVGVTIPFGRRSSVSADVTSQGSIQAQVQRSAALVGDWGYNVYVSAGDSNRAFGQVQYKSPVALLTAGIDQSAGTTTLRTETQGAISWVDGGLFPSNTIYDSFAVVDTNPVKRVHVLEENRNIGNTGRSGRLLVPDMRSFDLNHIGVVATDVPPDVTLDDATKVMRPQDRSGVVVKFAVKVSHAALLKLVDEAGVDLPLGSTATLKSTGVMVPVGYDGEAYVEDLAAHNELTLERPDGRHCSVEFDYRPIPGDVPTIGPLRCKEPRP